MGKLEKRAVICLTMAAVLLGGIILFVFRFISDGGKWATFYGNQSIYTEGRLSRGEIYDRNGLLLAKNTRGEVEYNQDEGIREACVQVVGDGKGNISTAALSAYKDKIIGYNIVTGTYSFFNKNQRISLTIDGEMSKVANEALGDRKGLVGVYNYKTGDILCMVSKPNFDPLYPKDPNDEDNSGMYLNKFLSGKFIPGSIFKLLTATAAIENLPELDDFSYTCPGVRIVGKDRIACVEAHGKQNFEEALANSCNGAFSVISDQLGASIMKEYTKKCGLTDVYNIDGIHNTKGSFEFPKNQVNLGWAGIGQYKDMINPCSFLTFVGAIANGGKSPTPQLIYSRLPNIHSTSRFMEEETSEKLIDMMKNNVVETYGKETFPGLDIYAKSGTAELGEGRRNNAWFTGFIKDDDHPYAFIVLVENGGFGMSDAGPIANKVLQYGVSH